MPDPILTDDEKGALLEGMSSGELEVHSNRGPTYAEVKPFEIGPRSRIETNSYPRLQHLNRQIAGRLSKQVELLLNVDAKVTFLTTKNCSYSDAGDNGVGLSLIVEFLPKPLHGSAFLSLGASTVGNLVETFFGGESNDAADREMEFFTPGELSVAGLFGETVISVIAEVWTPLEKISPEIAGTHLSSGVIDSVDAGDAVICCDFQLEFGGNEAAFKVLWPVATVAPLLPVFDGQKRERNTAEDSRWERALRDRITDAIVKIASSVGHTRMTLRAVADLAPGDIVTIGNPRSGTVSAGNVPLLAGRFGIHDGRYAVEAVHWLKSGGDSPIASSEQHRGN